MNIDSKIIRHQKNNCNARHYKTLHQQEIKDVHTKTT